MRVFKFVQNYVSPVFLVNFSTAVVREPQGRIISLHVGQLASNVKFCAFNGLLQQVEKQYRVTLEIGLDCSDSVARKFYVSFRNVTDMFKTSYER